MFLLTSSLVNRPQGLGFEPATTSSSAAAAPLVPLRSGTPARVFSAEGVRRSGEPLIGGNAAQLRRFCVRQLRSKWSRRERDADTQQHRSRTHTRRQDRTPGTRALVGDRTGHRQQDRKVVSDSLRRETSDTLDRFNESRLRGLMFSF